MAKINFSKQPPVQKPVRLEDVQNLSSLKPRRFALRDWKRRDGTRRDPLVPPGTWVDQSDWCLQFPFRESFAPAFDAAFPFVANIGWKETEKLRCFTFLKGVTAEEIEKIKAWISAISPFVGIFDRLCVSFALDYDREEGNPEKQQTEIGRLRASAKLYGSNQQTIETFQSADVLLAKCMAFLSKIAVYDHVEGIVPIPARRGKNYDLPTYLAKKISTEWKKEDLSDSVRTVMDREELKKLRVDKKLPEFHNSTEINSSRVRGKNILIVDDLYQSGTTVNCFGMELLEAGANRIFGLFCEKTLRNDDNTGGKAGGG